MSRPLAIAIAGLIASTAAIAATVSRTAPSLQPAAPADPSAVVGNQACIKCHAAEEKVWQQTPHSKTFEQLHRRPEAKQIAAKLSLRSIKHEGRCVACHYTQQNDPTGGAHAIAGVSCESCHGAARDWLDIHHDYGGEKITRLTESPEHRRDRLHRSIAAGMRNPENVYLVAQSCLRCHTTADEELVNVGGHSAGSLDFEFVAWSQGSVRHNFVRSDGKQNEVSSPERLRVMFVAGMIAELEASLRATAIATKKATYGVTAAKRAARAGARLKSVGAKIQDATIDEVLTVFESVTLKLNNHDQLVQAADRIAAFGYQFAQENDGSNLQALDAFIPKNDRWK